jgi:hypothetical protein
MKVFSRKEKFRLARHGTWERCDEFCTSGIDIGGRMDERQGGGNFWAVEILRSCYSTLGDGVTIRFVCADEAWILFSY